MRIRHGWLVVMILFSPSAAQAHDHFADLCVAGAVAFSKALPGVHVTYSHTVQTENPSKSTPPDEQVKRVTFVTDVSLHGDPGSGDDRDVNYLAGFRYTFARTRVQDKLPFVQVLLGGSHVKLAGQTDDDPAVAIGAGFEWVLKDSPMGLGIRVQADYIVRPGDVSPRISAGLVFRGFRN